jgi:hypothetical protein
MRPGETRKENARQQDKTKRKTRTHTETKGGETRYSNKWTDLFLSCQQCEWFDGHFFLTGCPYLDDKTQVTKLRQNYFTTRSKKTRQVLGNFHTKGTSIVIHHVNHMMSWLDSRLQFDPLRLQVIDLETGDNRQNWDTKRQDETRPSQARTSQAEPSRDRTGQDRTRCDKTRQGKAKQDKTRQDMTRQDKTRQR